MPNLFRNFSYPGTDFHEMNLEWLVDMCNKFIGLGLNVSGDKLRLVNDKGEVVSSVTVSYATKALTDQNGKNIDTYIFSVAGVGDTVVFTHGDGTSTAITIPYADKAKYDLTGHEIEDYIYNVQIAGDTLRITHGDGTIVDLTIPYAVKATNDANGKAIDTYGASLTVENDNVCLRDSIGRLLNSITVPYATKALKDVDGDAIKSTYAGELTTGTTTVILKAKDGTVLDTITVPFATEASHADNADLATLATDCTNAVETVAISGDYMVFTTYGGQAFSIQAPFAVKAQKDDLGNVIKTSYVANVTNDANTGKLQFRDAMGNIIVELLPTVDTAVHDDYGNAIADYIKSIVASSNSDYVTVTHGNGDVDTLTIHYADTAWKDTNGNVIKNTYIKSLAVEEDVNDGHYKLVAYNGDTPQAELFRIDIVAYSAQTDINGKDLTSYVADVDYNASKEIEVTDGAGNTLKTLANKLGNVADVNLTSPSNGDVLSYDSNADEWINTAGGGLQPYNAIHFEMGGCYYASNDYWSAFDFVNGSTAWSTQDPSWFSFLEPVVCYEDTNGDKYDCYRISDRTTVNIGGGTWIAGDMMGMFQYAITDGADLKSTCYYGIPNEPDKLLKVYIELTAGVITTNTAQIVSAGGGGSSKTEYVVFGRISGSYYVPNSDASVIADIDYGKIPAILYNSNLYPVMAWSLENLDTPGTLPFDNPVDFVADMKNGVYTGSDRYRIKMNTIMIGTNNNYLEVEFVVEPDVSGYVLAHTGTIH